MADRRPAGPSLETPSSVQRYNSTTHILLPLSRNGHNHRCTIEPSMGNPELKYSPSALTSDRRRHSTSPLLQRRRDAFSHAESPIDGLPYSHTRCTDDPSRFSVLSLEPRSIFWPDSVVKGKGVRSCPCNTAKN